MPEGKQLAREGEFAYEFFVIEEGTAEVTHEGECIAELGPGRLLRRARDPRRRAPHGRPSRPPRRWSLIVLTPGALRTVKQEHPEVAERLRRAVDERYAPA